MSTIGKVFVGLNLFLAVLFLGYASTTLATANEYKSKYEAELAAHDADKTELGEQLSAIQITANTAKTRSDELSGERDSEKARADRSDAELRDAKATNDTLNGAVEGIQSKLSDFDQKMADLQESKDAAMNARFEAENERDDAFTERDGALEAQRDAEDAARVLEQQVADLETTLFSANKMIAQKETEIATLVESTGVSLADVSVVPDIDASVLTVQNDLAPGFVALNVGKNQGVKRGYVFDVWSGADYKGQVKVMDVDDNVCSALVSRAKDGSSMQVGDRASTRM